MAVNFQLVFNGQLDDIEPLKIMPQIAAILAIDAQFVGAFFTGKPVVLTESNDFKAIQQLQKQLEAIDLFCDIKPVDIASKNTLNNTVSASSTLQMKREELYKSTFKTPDTDRHATLNLKSEDERIDCGLDFVPIETHEFTFKKSKYRLDDALLHQESEAVENTGSQKKIKWKG